MRRPSARSTCNLAWNLVVVGLWRSSIRTIGIPRGLAIGLVLIFVGLAPLGVIAAATDLVTTARMAGSFEPGFGYLLTLAAGLVLGFLGLVAGLLSARVLRPIYAELLTLPIGRGSALGVIVLVAIFGPLVATILATLLLAAYYYYYYGAGTFDFAVIAIFLSTLAVPCTVAVALTVGQRVLGAFRSQISRFDTHLLAVFAISVIALSAYFVLLTQGESRPGLSGLSELLGDFPIGWFFVRIDRPGLATSLIWSAGAALTIAVAAVMEILTAPLRRRAAQERPAPVPRQRGLGRTPLGVAHGMLLLSRRSLGVWGETIPWMFAVILPTLLGSLLLSMGHLIPGLVSTAVAGYLSTGPGHRVSATLGPFRDLAVFGLSKKSWAWYLFLIRLAWNVPGLILGAACLSWLGPAWSIGPFAGGAILLQLILLGASGLFRRLEDGAILAGLTSFGITFVLSAITVLAAVLITGIVER